MSEFFKILADVNAKLSVLENTIYGRDALAKSAAAQAEELTADLQHLAGGVFAKSATALLDLEKRLTNLEARDAVARETFARAGAAR